MKKLVYLDHNIYIAALNDPSIQDKIISLKDRGIRYVYSPAHIEEIHTANVKIPNYNKIAEKLFSLISKVTNNEECFPSNGQNAIILRKQLPRKCYLRVKGKDTVSRVYNDSVDRFSVDKSNYQNMINEDKHNTSISTISYEKIWDHSAISQAVDNFNRYINFMILRYNHKALKERLNEYLPENYTLSKGGFKIFRRSHVQLEFSIEILFRILNQNGYNSDKQLNTAISGTHDVSHAIYATRTNILLTSDKRFAEKCKAVYFFLGVPTEVVYCTQDKIKDTLDTI